VNIEEVKRLYVDELWTLRRIAEYFDTNHHMIKRKLIAGGVEIDNVNRRFGRIITKERRKQIGEQSKNRITWNKGVRASEKEIRRMMKNRMRTKIDLDEYPDLSKLQFLVRITSKHFKNIGFSDEVRKSFLDKFYFDIQFNRIYDKWQETGENKWYFPSLDHKVSKFNGGNWSINNIQFLTWFENRAKAEMNLDEWENFKLETNTKSDLFYDNN
jgi:hypothetical protein